ncbi:NAD(P)/FAD-dependent oxidoreductase [Paraburkholderia caledonica]|uniref:Glycine/D-amino acid oxidase-like deaminating enzyme n=1 Tax=Paraburkholderia caledonica TaxID=134536 RepID=A0AB73IMI9_9BURK|nr:glycine/D-amino acid oxidase-like deaminating enzyme [Paraburkholderia caledonica]
MLAGEALRFPRSLWVETVARIPMCEPLRGSLDVDVAIVGAGFTGLSTAIHLAERGISSIVLDAAQPGWGASGRNNGQVIAGLKQDPDVVQSIWPGAEGRKLIDFASEAPSRVFDLIRRFGIDCSATNAGWIQPAYNETGRRAIIRRFNAWRSLGVDATLIHGTELSDLLGTNRYVLGWMDPRGGSVHPLSYVRGLNQVALSLGVRVFGDTKVERVMRVGEQYIVMCPEGSVTARHVVIATAAYSEDIVPGLKQSFVAVRTAQVATRPLSPNMRDKILPGGHVASDTRQLLTSFRQSPDGRLVMGGAGATAGVNHAGIVPYLRAAGEDLFGSLGKLHWEFEWSGYFAVTTDHLPHIHEPTPNMVVAVGCNGRGIAISTSIGIEMARYIADRDAAQLSIPLTGIGKVPFHRYRSLGVGIATRIKRIQDRFG